MKGCNYSYYELFLARIFAFVCLWSIYFNNLPFKIVKPVHEISKNVVCANSKASDQPAHTRSLIRASASRLNIHCV